MDDVCASRQELGNHILIHCKKACLLALGPFLFAIWDPLCTSKEYQDLLLKWHGPGGGRDKRLVWRVSTCFSAFGECMMIELLKSRRCWISHQKIFLLELYDESQIFDLSLLDLTGRLDFNL